MGLLSKYVYTRQSDIIPINGIVIHQKQRHFVLEIVVPVYPDGVVWMD